LAPFWYVLGREILGLNRRLDISRAKTWQKAKDFCVHAIIEKEVLCLQFWWQSDFSLRDKSALSSYWALVHAGRRSGHFL